MANVLLFNPFSAKNGYRIPNSILQVAASIEGKHEYVIIDGNLEKDPWGTISEHLENTEFDVFGCTVMPGPQLQQAIPITRKIKRLYPQITSVWGGYFPSNQYESVIRSNFVDFIIDGPGDKAFPALINSLVNDQSPENIENLIFLNNDQIIKTKKIAIYDQDALPVLPYSKLNEFYPLRKYLKRTFLGKHTAAYHSSMGCPFTCSFCAVVPIYNARWKGKSANLIVNDINYLIHQHGADSVEFHDNNFFVSEKRVVEFSEKITSKSIHWWGEGRIDTIDHFSDKSLEIMRRSGCKMIFFGAETGNDDVLSQMNKGGTQNAAQIREFAAKMKLFDIIPEYSFVLGLPARTEKEVNDQIDRDIAFIKEIKEINPQTEIIIYLYSPVPTAGSELFEQVTKAGFRFPANLEDWLNPEWLNFDLRKNPLTPWLKPYMVDKIQGFETVLNARFPTITDTKLTLLQRNWISWFSKLRYQAGIYKYPFELKVLQHFWLRYRRPETEGFYMD